MSLLTKKKILLKKLLKYAKDLDSDWYFAGVEAPKRERKRASYHRSTMRTTVIMVGNMAAAHPPMVAIPLKVTTTSQAMARFLLPASRLLTLHWQRRKRRRKWLFLMKQTFNKKTPVHVVDTKIFLPTHQVPLMKGKSLYYFLWFCHKHCKVWMLITINLFYYIVVMLKCKFDVHETILRIIAYDIVQLKQSQELLYTFIFIKWYK